MVYEYLYTCAFMFVYHRLYLKIGELSIRLNKHNKHTWISSRVDRQVGTYVVTEGTRYIDK